jgi:uncharacterized membrane protein
VNFAILILGLLLFLGVHSVSIVAPAYREARMRSMGGGAWRGVYSVLSAIGFLLIVWGYARAQPTAPVLYVPAFWLTHVTVLLMALAMIALAVYALPAGRLKPALKHPMLVSVKIWALAHLLANGDLASLILFLSFLAWAVFDRISLKRRQAALPEPGPVRNDVFAIIAGLAIWALFIWKLHEWLIGVPVPIA